MNGGASGVDSASQTHRAATAIKLSTKWTPYLFLLPFLAVFAVFVAYPLLQSAVLAAQQTYGPRTTTFVGFSNFRNLARDPLFWQAVRNTLLYTAGSLLVQLPLSLGLALLLNQAQFRAQTLLRLIFFAPSLVGMAYVAVLFEPILAKNTGLLNVGLNSLIGFDLEYAWLDEHVMTALILISVWMFVGFNMVYFLAALQNVDRSLVEAARLDGAGALRVFWHITLPAIRPVASFVVLLSIVGSLQLFELPFVMLRFTAGPGNNGLTVLMYLYRIGFETGDLGYASAIGWCLAIVLVMVAIAQRRMLSRFDE